MVRKIMGELKERGVGEVVVGYPKDIARNHGNKLTVNFWNYGYAIRRFKEIGEELGIRVIGFDEQNTSKTCSLCGEAHEGGLKEELKRLKIHPWKTYDDVIKRLIEEYKRSRHAKDQRS
jgi:transposase